MGWVNTIFTTEHHHLIQNKSLNNDFLGDSSKKPVRSQIPQYSLETNVAAPSLKQTKPTQVEVGIMPLPGDNPKSPRMKTKSLKTMQTSKSVLSQQSLDLSPLDVKPTHQQLAEECTTDYFTNDVSALAIDRQYSYLTKTMGKDR